MKRLFLLLLFFPFHAFAQKAPFVNNAVSAACAGYGMVPDQAIPVCGSKVFHQDKVTTCTGPNIDPAACSGDPFPSTRSFWYKFKCFQAGTLGFLLTPMTITDDYDFIVFDVTGHNPNDVFTDPTLVLTLNGTGSTGITGCGPTGTTLIECYTTPGVLINKMPDLIAGHNYLLMVTNYSNSPAGYDLSFQDGTAVISDGVPPAIDHVVGGCSVLDVFFTTDIKCNSVTFSGSEFTINPGNIKPSSVVSNCANGDLTITSLTVNLPFQLAAGNYTLTVNDGTDADTYRNVCDDSMPRGTVANFTVQRPIAGFDAPLPNCDGTNFFFITNTDPLPGNTITEYHWNFGDPASGSANTSNLPFPGHVFSAPGTYQVTYWIVNSRGCNSDTLIKPVTVLPHQAIAWNSGSSNQIVCVNTPITPFTLIISGGATGIGTPLMLPPGVTATLSGNIVTVAGTPTLAGSYFYSIGTTGTCNPAWFDGLIIVKADATLVRTSAAGTDAQEICKNSAIIPITYDFGGGATGVTVTGLPPGVVSNIVGNTVTISGSPTVASGTAYTYTVSTQGPCVKPLLTGTILVNPLPVAAFSFTAPTCETRVISFTDGSVPNVGVLDQWNWDFGDGPPGSTLQNPTHIYATAGTYNVTLSVRNDKGCISNPVSSSVINISNRPQAGFIIPEVCLNDSYAQFIDTSKLLNAAINRWVWNFGDPGSGALNSSTLQNPTHSYSTVGAYNVSLIVWNNTTGCRDTIIQPLFINGSFPVANFNISNAPSLCANVPVEITEASSVFPGNITKTEIYWDNVNAPGVFDTDNTPFTGKVYTHLYPNFQSPLTKTFTIRYRAYSGGVCVNDKLQNITVHAAPLVQFNNIPNTCLLVPPFQLTQASETGAVPGTGVYSGPGTSASGMFDPQVAGVGTHTITYTYTASAAGCTDFRTQTITVLDTAHATFSVVLPSCEQLPTSFTDLSTAPGSVTLNNTVWDFGDLSPAENHAPGSTFGHLYPGPGTYHVTMYNESVAGCRSTVTDRFITIDPNHSLSLTSANNVQTVCINTPIAPITYTLGGGATGVLISGLPTGVSYAVTGNTLTITGTPSPASGGPLFPFTIWTTGNTCLQANAIGSITVNPDHTIAFTSGDESQSVCVNTPIDPIVYTLGGGATGVTIANLPPGITYTVTGNTVTISGSPTTTAGGPLFPYAIQTTGNSCVKANAAGEIRVNPYPVPAFTLDKPHYCIPNAVVGFKNISTMPDGTQMTYAWDFGEPSSGINNNSTLLNPSHWYTSTGPFNVKLAARSLALLNGNVIGCLHDTVIAITNIHPQPVADFYQSQPSACLGDVVTFRDKTDQNTGVTTEWYWDMGDGLNPRLPAFTHVYADTLEYNIRFYTVNIYGCNSDTISRLFKVYPNPTVYAGEDRMILQDIKIVLSPTATGADLQYVWSPNLYFVNNNNTVKNPVAIGIKDDITYTLTVTSRGGCKRHDDVYIKILKPPVIPNTFSPNNDGVNDQWQISYLNDYPDCRVEVFTRAGQLVFRSAKGYPVPWDGMRNGKAVPFDTYYYVIEPGYGRDPITGYVTILK